MADVPPKLRWTFVSIALFSVGLLILVPSGLCTAVFGVMSLTEGDGLLGFALIAGGLPMALGIGLVLAGLEARRSRDED